MDPQQAQTAKMFDTHKDTYSKIVDASVSFTGLSTDFFTKVKAGYILDVTRASVGHPEDLSILDVGCGVGNYHSLLAPNFKSLSGVDISSACVEMARRRNVAADYKVYGGETLPYESGIFDVAFTICVMHHVPPSQWQNFAHEMRRVLKPGGLALIFEHNPRNPFTMRVVNSCPFDADAVLLQSDTTEDLLRQAGFNRVVSRYILSIPAANGFLRRVDRLFSRFAFGGQYYVMGTA